MTLRTRLAVLAALILSASVGIVSLVQYQSSSDALLDPIDQRLQRLGSELSTRRPPPQPQGIDPVQRPEGRDTAFTQFVNGELVTSESSGFGSDPDPLPEVTADVGDDLEPGEWKLVDLESADGDLAFRSVVAVTVQDGSDVSEADTPAVVVSVFSQPLDQVSATLTHLRTTSLIAGALALICGALSVWWVVRRSFRPIEETIATAEAIGAGDLSLRVPEPARPQELRSLGRSINSMLESLESSRESELAARTALTQFVADASHELRTPLAAVSGHTELLRSGALDDAGSQRSMARISSETARMHRLVEDLLTLASHDTGNRRPHRDVNFSNVVTDALEDRVAIDPDRTFFSSVEPNLRIDGDSQQLLQIVANLLANVTAHTPVGTEATVSAAYENGDVVLDVSDSGPGVSEEHRAQLFTRFYRSGVSNDARGAGLGLAIVTALVEEHGGTITTEPSPAGLRVRVCMPRG